MGIIYSVGRASEQVKLCCPECSSTRLIHNGWAKTVKLRVDYFKRMYRCKACNLVTTKVQDGTVWATVKG